MQLTISSYSTSDATVVLVLRAADYAGAPALRAAIADAVTGATGARRIVVGLTGLRAIDTIGIATLAVGRRICGDLGVDLPSACSYELSSACSYEPFVGEHGSRRK